MNWAWVNAMRMQLDFGPLTTNTLLIGQEGSTTPLHFDEQENFLHQIGGTKTCYLYAPSYYKYFYPYSKQHHHWSYDLHLSGSCFQYEAKNSSSSPSI